jgi:hypothetical protein
MVAEEKAGQFFPCGEPLLCSTALAGYSGAVEFASAFRVRQSSGTYHFQGDGNSLVLRVLRANNAFIVRLLCERCAFPPYD